MIVLDTHVWVWWLSQPEALSARARTRVNREAVAKAVYVSSVSVWEVALLVARGRLRLTMRVDDWVARAEALPFVHFVPVDNAVALRSVSLPGTLHNDPADRIVIATALILGAPVITKDQNLRRYAHVKTIWKLAPELT